MESTVNEVELLSTSPSGSEGACPSKSERSRVWLGGARTKVE